MPAARNEAQAERKNPKFDAQQTDALGAFIQANGGGPTVIRDENGEIAQSSLRGNDIGRGSELFRQNCASCHNFTGRGGALSSGKFAPNLDPANEQQIYAAMVTGPQNMPKFSDRQLTLEEKQDIIAYIKSASETQDPADTASEASGRALKVPRCSPLASSRSSVPHCGSEQGHE